MFSIIVIQIAVLSESFIAYIALERFYACAKQFKCHVCDKRFTRSSTLNQHYRIHKDEKPFKCRVCGEEFSYRANRNKHELNTHKSCRFNAYSAEFNGNCNLLRNKTKHGDSAKILHCKAINA
ncbi:hypothetical protein DINM_007274 [Dirofilaria immitis]|nr:hypothetical protein [Dirofilaria immitis]